MKSFPCELVRSVFSFLPIHDIAALRLVCTSFAAIGLQFLFQMATLVFKAKSFDNLLALAGSPAAKRVVKSLHYDADTLVHHPLKVSWIWDVVGRGWANGLPKKVPPPPEFRILDKDSARRATVAYRKYLRYYSEQEKMRQADYNIDKLAMAMAQFPNLTDITMSMMGDPSARRHGFNMAFTDAYMTASGEHCPTVAIGVPQARSLLLGAYEADRKLQVFRCGLVSWQLFRQDPADFKKMKEVIKSLKELELDIEGFTKETAFDIDGPGALLTDVPKCAECLKASGYLRDFVTAAPDLRSLAVSFRSTGDEPLDLKTVVGDFTWSDLRRVSLGAIKTTEADLVEFFNRHATTLNAITLRDITLTDGSWITTFQTLRRILNLREAACAGSLIASNDKKEVWNFPGDTEHAKITKYLLAGGDGPPIDLISVGSENHFFDCAHDDSASCDCEVQQIRALITQPETSCSLPYQFYMNPALHAPNQNFDISDFDVHDYPTYYPQGGAANSNAFFDDFLYQGDMSSIWDL